MKNVSAPLMTLLTSTSTNELCICDLLTITLNDGTVVCLSNADQDVTWNGQLYSSGRGNITFVRSKTSSKIGVEVAEMDLTLMANTSALTEGLPTLQFVRNSGLDAARVRLDRLFLTAWNAPVGIVNNFLGRVSTLDVTRTAAKIKVKSYVVMMDLQLPKNTYQPTCLHSLYDSGCTLNRASYSASMTAGVHSNQMYLTTGTMTQPTGYFTQGYVQFTSGQNAGERRTVLSSGAGAFQLQMPLLYPPAVGDAFTAYAGCDHSSATCTAKFNNLSNFRGYEFVPFPETAL